MASRPPLPRYQNLIMAVAANFFLAAIATAQAPAPSTASQQAVVLVPIFTVTGKGVQIYTCQQSTTGPKWVFQAPEATLTDAVGKSVGTHGAGPIWISNDGSSVKGRVFRTVTHDPAAIPWLTLEATDHSGNGIMTRVKDIERSNTQGGIAPTTGCDEQHLNATVRIPYTATYTFSSEKPWTAPQTAP